jgi:hypothetical protein
MIHIGAHLHLDFKTSLGLHVRSRPQKKRGPALARRREVPRWPGDEELAAAHAAAGGPVHHFRRRAHSPRSSGRGRLGDRSQYEVMVAAAGPAVVRSVLFATACNILALSQLIAWNRHDRRNDGPALPLQGRS